MFWTLVTWLVRMVRGWIIRGRWIRPIGRVMRRVRLVWGVIRLVWRVIGLVWRVIRLVWRVIRWIIGLKYMTGKLSYDETKTRICWTWNCSGMELDYKTSR
jgi:hypothetical protein